MGVNQLEERLLEGGERGLLELAGEDGGRQLAGDLPYVYTRAPLTGSPLDGDGSLLAPAITPSLPPHFLHLALLPPTPARRAATMDDRAPARSGKAHIRPGRARACGGTAACGP